MTCTVINMTSNLSSDLNNNIIKELVLLYREDSLWFVIEQWL